MNTSIATLPLAPLAPRGLLAPNVAALPAHRAAASVRRLLDGVPVPAILLAADRRIVARNAAAELVPDVLAFVALSYGRVTRFAGAASEPFERVFARALNGAAASAVVTLPSGGRQALWRVNLGRLEHRDTDEAAVLMLIDPPPAAVGTLTALQRLFGLTAAEARVLALLLDDCRPREIADELQISITTVRSHLQALFSKTGTRRQSELVALAWSAA
ncbi:MAG TPA: helix-turn-helix transcriptional regulator [Burkholderiaceae bacterium]|nr:helix-turn-helix transcriptional regulator [Burkholderiaceae bacterium]